MTINEYQQRAMASLNPELKGRDVLINSVMGLCGESGEAIDIVMPAASALLPVTLALHPVYKQ